MAILQYDTFEAALADWTLIQLGATITVVADEMVLHQTDTDSTSWDRIRAAHTAGQATAVAQIIYCQINIETFTGVSEDLFSPSLSSSLDTPGGNFVGTLSAAINAGELSIYDDTAGTYIGATAILENTWYDLRFTVTGASKANLAFRASNSVGNLPAGSGSWTNIGTSTNNVPANIFTTFNLHTANPNTDLNVTEYYYTNDGLFNPPEPTEGLGASDFPDFLLVYWIDNGTAISETGFSIEKSVDNGAFSEIAEVAFGLLEYEDHDVTYDTAYAYKMRSFVTLHGTKYYSPYSGTNTFDPQPAPADDAGEDLLALGDLE